jgi:hypothetical protein
VPGAGHAAYSPPNPPSPPPRLQIHKDDAGKDVVTFPTHEHIPAEEVVIVLDCDMKPKKTFFLRVGGWGQGWGWGCELCFSM